MAYISSNWFKCFKLVQNGSKLFKMFYNHSNWLKIDPKIFNQNHTMIYKSLFKLARDYSDWFKLFSKRFKIVQIMFI